MSNYSNGCYIKDKTKIEKQLYCRKIIEQRLLGLLLIALAALVVWFASTGIFIEDRDVTAAFLMAPMGVYMLFTRHLVIV